MAATGIRHFIYAKYSKDQDGKPTYTGKKTPGKSISADLNIDNSETILYCEDQPDEVDREFGGGTLAIGVKQLDYPTQADFFGHKFTAKVGENPDTLKANSDDQSNDLGVGFYTPVRTNDNKKMYEAFFFYRVNFGEPSLSFKTKEKTVTYTTPTTTGSILTLDNGDWKESALCETAEKAAAWVDNIFISVTGT